jgi:heme oxygenase
MVRGNTRETDRRGCLKRGTAELHQAVDGLMDRSGMLSSRSGYSRYLHATLLARSSIETRLVANGVADLYSIWPKRQISHLVERDLVDLEPKTQPQSADTNHTAMSPGAMLGALYVLEGSALGARVIARRVEVIGMGPTFGARHLKQQTAEPTAWPTFLELLDTTKLTAVEDEDCIREASSTFESFLHHYSTAA